jgi:hypothetical protein
LIPKNAPICPRKTPLESFCCSRRTGLQRGHTTPVETCKQRFKLGRVQPQNTIADGWPFKRILLKPLLGHHQTSAVPPYHLEPVSTLCAEHIDCSIKRFLLQVALHQRRQTVMAFAEVDRLGCDKKVARRAMGGS